MDAALGRDPVVGLDGQPLVMGVDVARFGDDASVVLARQGQEIAHLSHYRGMDTMRLAALVAEAANRLRPAALMSGRGGRRRGRGGPAARARLPRGRRQRGRPRARPDAVFEPARRDVVEGARLAEGGGRPAIGCARELADDLCAPEYGFDDAGRLRLERKEDMKARGLPSPDFGDALALTFAEPVSLAAWDGRERPRYALSEWDPFDPPGRGRW